MYLNATGHVIPAAHHHIEAATVCVERERASECSRSLVSHSEEEEKNEKNEKNKNRRTTFPSQAKATCFPFSVHLCGTLLLQYILANARHWYWLYAHHLHHLQPDILSPPKNEANCRASRMISNRGERAHIRNTPLDE